MKGGIGRLNCIVYKTNKEYYEISTIYECIEKKSMIIDRL